MSIDDINGKKVRRRARFEPAFAALPLRRATSVRRESGGWWTRSESNRSPKSTSPAADCSISCVVARDPTGSRLLSD